MIVGIEEAHQIEWMIGDFHGPFVHVETWKRTCSDEGYKIETVGLSEYGLRVRRTATIAYDGELVRFAEGLADPADIVLIRRDQL